MVENPTNAAVLFADIVDSSRLYEESGDEYARRVVMECLNVMSHAVEANGGRIVDRIGDEIMGLFPTAAAAAAGGAAVQRAIDAARAVGTLPNHLRVRVGFHGGPVLVDGDRVFGTTVYVARRLATLAKGQQILTTAETLGMLDTVQVVARGVDHQHLKGASDSFDIVEILWDPRAATVRIEGWKPPASVAHSLVVTLGLERRLVDASRPTLTIGRDGTCDLTVEHPRVSRLHARIEWRRSGFFLVDVSTNGTRVIDPSTGASAFVRRDEVQLTARGTIELGPRETDEEPSPTLSFSTDA